MAASHLLGTRCISPLGCGSQIFLLLTLGGGECFLFAAMACDHYVAICHPLSYAVLMNQRLCLHMATGSWLLGASDGLMQAVAPLSSPCCCSRLINHFCEAPSLTRLACADTVVFEFFLYVCCVLKLLIPLSLILASYGLILAAVQLMKSTAARKKAFATCSSHLAIVGLFFGTLIFTYMWPKSYCSVAHDKVVSAFYTISTPVLNPLIYSVRNEDVKVALRKWMEEHFM
ncbi:Olfactory receptor 2T12 [Manis javanica]|nr:Olfactory receptor 2T12 [Manis javanica]